MGSPLTLTQLNHVNYAICSPSSPYGIHRGGFIPSESLWSVKKKKKKLKIESKVFSGLPSAGGLLYVVGPSRLQRRERRGVLVLRYVRLLCLLYCAETKGGALLRGFGQTGRQDMSVVAALTVNSGDKVLKGTAVKGESGGPLPFLVLLNGLQDQLFLKGDENGNWHQ